MSDGFKSVLAGNWKLYKTREDVDKFFAELSLPPGDEIRKIIAASPTLLEKACKLAENHGVEIFSQNVAYKAEGALTGEISPRQLVEIGVKGSLVGHSERRQFFAETDESAALRARVALEHGLDVIFCIGETLEERRHGKFRQIIEGQLVALLEATSEFEPTPLGQKLILAYEPVWAIGTGVVASVAEIAEAHQFIEQYTSTAGRSMKVLYGGSVKPDNFREISQIPHVSGGLVGGASLDPKSYNQLYECLTSP